MTAVPVEKSAEQKAWEAEKVKLFDAAQPYSEFERLLSEAEEEKKLLFGGLKE